MPAKGIRESRNPGKGGRGKTLVQTAQDTGAPATPATPMGALNMGASPDAAKMAGTPNAMANVTQGIQPPTQPAPGAAPTDPTQPPTATDLAQQSIAAAPPIPPPPAGAETQPAPGAPTAAPTTPPPAAPAPMQGDVNTLSAYERTAANAARGVGQDELARRETQERLKASLGDTGLRVEKLIDDASKRGAGNVQLGTGFVMPQQKDIDAHPAFASMTPEKREVVKDALQALANNPTDPNTLADAQRALDSVGADTSNPLSFLTKKDTGEALAAATSDRMDAAARQAAGITDEELQQLGLDPAEVDKMTPDQLRAAISDRGHLQDQVDVLRQQLSDPTLSSQEKEGIRRQLQSLGASGAVSAEARLGEAITQATAGETITIGGREMTADELLSDQGFEQLAKEYLEAGPDDPIRAEIEKVLPGFSAWARENNDALKGLAQKAGDNQAKVLEIQAGNQALIEKLTSSSGLPAADVTKLINDVFGSSFDRFSGTPIDIGSSGLLSTMLDPTAMLAAGVDPTKVIGDLQGLKQSDPDAWREIMKMTPKELSDSQILTSPDAFGEFMANQTALAGLSEMTDEQIAEKLFGSASMEDVYANYVTAKRLGTLPEGTDTFDMEKILDSNDDGVVDAGPLLRENLKKYKDPRLAAEVKSLGKMKGIKGGNQQVVDAFRDGTMDADEAAGLDVAQTDVRALTALAASPELDPGAKPAISKKIDERRGFNTDTAMKDLNPNTGIAYFQGLTEILGNGAEYAPQKAVDAFMSQLRNVSGAAARNPDIVPPREQWPKQVLQAAQQATYKDIHGASRDDLVHKYEWAFLQGHAPAYLDKQILEDALRRAGVDPASIGKGRGKTGMQKIGEKISKAMDSDIGKGSKYATGGLTNSVDVTAQGMKRTRI